VLPLVVLMREIEFGIGGSGFGIAVGHLDAELGFTGPLRLGRGHDKQGAERNRNS
jgi:hypothetical protein